MSEADATNKARAAAQDAARDSYGRLLAWLASRTGDVAGAEDALAEAFRAALEHWPQDGVPASPEAWLVTAAKRKMIDQSRKAATRVKAEPALLLASEEAEAQARSESPFPDKRLELMFICAHPAIDENVCTPLMLQTVLGLDAASIASAFLTSPAAMSARLVRAKQKIKAAKISFAEPSLEDLPDRMAAVLNAVYAAFGAGWNDVDGGDEDETLEAEAIFLARLLAALAPEEPEAYGLLALMLHAHGRRRSRYANNVYTPLEEQDLALWDMALIDEAEALLAKAWDFRRPGRFQYEAAIQSAHAASRRHGVRNAEDVLLLYKALLQLAPSVGAQVGYAAALAKAGRMGEAQNILDAIKSERISAYQPYWAVRAYVSKMRGDAGADTEYDRAIGLSTNEALRAFLRKQKTATD